MNVAHDGTPIMNVAYDLEFDLDGFLSSLEKGRGARQREEYRDTRRHKDEGAGYDDSDD
jgi:hypothetical protein